MNLTKQRKGAERKKERTEVGEEQWKERRNTKFRWHSKDSNCIPRRTGTHTQTHAHRIVYISRSCPIPTVSPTHRTLAFARL